MRLYDLFAFHPFQNDVPREELLSALHMELINRVNEVGVDINKAFVHTHWGSQLQFVGGLGPRKAGDILKVGNLHLSVDISW